MNQPQAYMCPPNPDAHTPPPSPSYCSWLSHNTGFGCPASCIDLALDIWFTYGIMEYYSAMKRNAFESVLMKWMNLKPIKQSEVGQQEKDEYRILRHVYRI